MDKHECEPCEVTQTDLDDVKVMLLDRIEDLERKIEELEDRLRYSDA